MATLNAATVAVNFVAGTAEYTNSMQKALNATGTFEKSLQKQIDTFGMSRDEARLYGLAQRGVSEETLKTARSLMEQKKALEANAASMARGRQIAESVITPQERYRNTVGELSGLLRRGHIDQTTYGRAMANARNEMIQSSAAFQGLTGGLSGVMAATGPVGIAIGVVVAAVAGLAVAAGATGAALFGMALRGGDSISKLLDAAQAMGVTTQALAEMRTAAELNGSSADAMDTGMQKLTQVLGDAVGGTETAQKAFARLGLNFEQLAGMTPDAVFRATAEAINGMKNPYEQASAAQDIFGKNYAALMPLLRAGPEAFAEGAEKARLFGLAVGQVDAMRVDQAMDSWKQIGMIFAGITQSLAVELAPLIREIGNSFAVMAERVGGVGSFISAFVREAIIGFAAVGDGVMLLGQTYWDYLGRPINNANISIIDGIKRVAGALGNLEYVLTGESKAGDAIQDMADSYMQQLRKAGKINDEAFKAWSNRTFQDRAIDFMAAAKAQRSAMERALTPPVSPTFKKPEDETAAEQMNRNQRVISDLQLQAETFGMSAKEVTIYKMALDGASVAEMTMTAALYDKLEGMKKQQAMMDEGKRLTEQMMTEEEKRAKQLERYQELLDSGAITQETYNRAVNKVQQRTDMKDLGGQEVKSIASREIRFNASIPGAKRFTDELKAPTKETAKNTEDTAKATEETNRLIKERFGFDVVEIL